MRANLLWICLILFSTVVIITVFFSFQNLRQIIVTPNSPFMPSPLPDVPTPTLDPDREFSILLLGYGGAGHDGGALTDSIVLANIQPHNHSATLISIPRDLWVELPLSTSEPTFSKINSAFPFGYDDRKYPHKAIEFTGPAGGGQLVKKIVSDITGKPIDYFIAIDFSGFTKIVDQLGGLDLKITSPFEDKFYPLEIGATDSCGKSPEEIIALEATLSGDKLDQQFTCRYEDLKFSVGTTHVDGTTALKYVRSRHAQIGGGDFNRSNRQRQVILAIKDKVIKLNFISKIIPIFKTISAHIRTDIPLYQIEKYLSRASEFSEYQISSVSLNDKNVLTQGFVNRQSVLIPTGGINKFHEIQQYITDQQAPPAIH